MIEKFRSFTFCVCFYVLASSFTLVVANTAGKCPSSCGCGDDVEDVLDDSLEACENACLNNPTCISFEYEDNWDHDCKLCTNICSTDLGGTSHHWCYTRTDITTTSTIMGKKTTTNWFLSKKKKEKVVHFKQLRCAHAITF
jgi:hypothetical protein